MEYYLTGIALNIAVYLFLIFLPSSWFRFSLLNLYIFSRKLSTESRLSVLENIDSDIQHMIKSALRETPQHKALSDRSLYESYLANIKLAYLIIISPPPFLLALLAFYMPVSTIRFAKDLLDLVLGLVFIVIYAGTVAWNFTILIRIRLFLEL